MLSHMDITDGPSPDFTPIPYLGEQRKWARSFPEQTQALVTAGHSLLGFMLDWGRSVFTLLT